MRVEFHMIGGARVDMELRDLEMGPIDLVVRTLPGMHPDTRITLGSFAKKLGLRVGDIRRVAVWDGLRLIAESTRLAQQH